MRWQTFRGQARPTSLLPFTPRFPHRHKPRAYLSSMTDLSARVDALTNAARAVRIQLVDNWHKIIRIDTISDSQHLTKWAALRDTFQKLVNDSESSAAVLAGTIKSYLVFHPYLEDSRALDDLIVEFEALDRRLPTLRFSGDETFVLLSSTLEDLRVELQTNDGSVQAQNAVRKAQSEVVALEEELEEARKKANRARESTRNVLPFAVVSYFGRVSGLWSLHRSAASDKAEVQRLTQEVEQASERLSSARIKLGAVERDLNDVNGNGISLVLQDMQKNLAKMRELLNSIWNELIQKLTSEIQTYLAAARKGLANASPQDQLAFRNAAKRIASSSAAWKEAATILIDGYAKAMK
ncbi:hypothetical protein C8Q76DRAFT_788325 [Earliella scabrosa]|nr:hypothetical protein C8Q76DRAFT_788325 [Earliella scabrosa]